MPYTLRCLDRCIDCDACRWLAPQTFSRVNEQSAVVQQPSDSPARLAALQALLACPTASIHTSTPPADIEEAHASFPLLVDSDAPDVYYCGYHSPKSYGAASYIVRCSSGNVMVDSPRWSTHLATQLERLGGVAYIVLTHRDDVADAAQWAERFGAARIMHEADVGTSGARVERVLCGDGPWALNHEGAPGPEADVHIIHTPGHTRGSTCLLHTPHGGTLFSGDHLAAAEAPPHELQVWEDFNWYSVSKQLDSVAKLRGLPFVRILPGHGRRASFPSAEAKDAALDALLAARRGL